MSMIMILNKIEGYGTNMALISMAEVLKGRAATSRSKQDTILFRSEYSDKDHDVAKYKYMAFTVGETIMVNAGWKAGDFLNLVIDTVTKKCILESATQTTGRTLAKCNKASKKCIIRFPYIEDIDLPKVDRPIITTDVKVFKGKVKFQI